MSRDASEPPSAQCSMYSKSIVYAICVYPHIYFKIAPIFPSHALNWIKWNNDYFKQIHSINCILCWMPFSEWSLCLYKHQSPDLLCRFSIYSNLVFHGCVLCVSNLKKFSTLDIPTQFPFKPVWAVLSVTKHKIMKIELIPSRVKWSNPLTHKYNGKITHTHLKCDALEWMRGTAEFLKVSCLTKIIQRYPGIL